MVAKLNTTVGANLVLYPTTHRRGGPAGFKPVGGVLAGQQFRLHVPPTLDQLRRSTTLYSLPVVAMIPPRDLFYLATGLLVVGGIALVARQVVKGMLPFVGSAKLMMSARLKIIQLFQKSLQHEYQKNPEGLREDIALCKNRITSLLSEVEPNDVLLPLLIAMGARFDRLILEIASFGESADIELRGRVIKKFMSLLESFEQIYKLAKFPKLRRNSDRTAGVVAMAELSLEEVDNLDAAAGRGPAVRVR